MKKYLAHILFIAVFGGVFLVGSGSASARTATWDGEGADNNWSTAANWDTDVAPVDGDDLVFTLAAFSDGDEMNNDIADLDISSVVMSGDNSAGSYFTVEVSGNSFNVSDLPYFDDSAADQWRVSVSANLVLSGDLTLGGSGAVNRIDLGVNTLTIDNSSEYLITSELLGSGNIVTSDTSFSLYGDETVSNDLFTGTITANSGSSVGVIHPSSLGNANSVIINENASIFFQRNENTFTAPFTFNGSGRNTSPKISAYKSLGGGADGGVTVEGTVILADVTLLSNVDFAGQSNLVVESINGDFTVTSQEGNVASLTLPGGQTVEADYIETIIGADDDQPSLNINVDTKKLTIVNGVRGSVNLIGDGILKGSGKVGIIRVSGGRIEPGQSPGCLTTDGVNWIDGNPTGVLQIEAQGLTVCTEYDQFVVSEAATEVNIAGLTLELTHLGDFTTTGDDQFVIIRNQSSEAITGTFVGLAEGATFVVDGMTYQINYNVGEGENDVVLTRIVAPGEPDSGLGSIANINYVWMLALGAVFMAGSGLALAKRN